MRAPALLLLAALAVRAAAPDAGVVLEELKRDFDAALETFEDKEAAQLCVALAGKADVGLLLDRLKQHSEFGSLGKAEQAATVSRTVGNVVGYCIDKLAAMAPLARANLAELLHPSKRLTERETEGILLYEKAVLLALGGGSHSLSEDVGRLLAVIEKHKKAQDGSVEQTFGKMQESLHSKRKLNEEITEFEQKQQLTLGFTLLVILASSVALCCCWIWYKSPASEQASKQAVEYELTGTPEEREKKAASMKKLADTLALMDLEIAKLKEELASLKQR